MTQQVTQGGAPAEDGKSDLLSGYAEIGAYLGLSERQAKHVSANGKLPTFKLPGSTIVRARRSTLKAWLAEREAAAAKGTTNGQ